MLQDYAKLAPEVRLKITVPNIATCALYLYTNSPQPLTIKDSEFAMSCYYRSAMAISPDHKNTVVLLKVHILAVKMSRSLLLALLCVLQQLGKSQCTCTCD